MPVGADGRADVAAIEAAITPNTAVIVGSAPCFPHGLIDPIEELSRARARRAASASTPTPASAASCCRGREQLGYDVPPFDFRVPGVTSMSADTHKYGYAAKGTSVVLYRDGSCATTSTSRPRLGRRALLLADVRRLAARARSSAACWAAMVSLGEEGYLDATRRILETGRPRQGRHREDRRARGDRRPALERRVHGRADVDIYRVLDVHGPPRLEPQRAAGPARRSTCA